MDHSARKCALAYKHTAGPVACRTNRQYHIYRRRPSRRQLPFQGSSNQKPSKLVCTYCQVGVLASLVHFVYYLRARLSEPCTRGALKNTHPSVDILLSSSGISATSRVTNTTIYSVMKQRRSLVLFRGNLRGCSSQCWLLERSCLRPSNTTILSCVDGGSWSSLGSDAVQRPPLSAAQECQNHLQAHCQHLSQQDNRSRQRLGRTSH